jgi:hypothetical protein
MGHLIISFMAAMFMAATVYMQTSSFALAFLAYSGAGVLVFLTGLIASALAIESEKDLSVART